MDEDKGNSRDEISPDSTRRMVSLADNVVDSRDLFIATKEIIIAHRGESYRLRLTSQNKLILTK